MHTTISRRTFFTSSLRTGAALAGLAGLSSTPARALEPIKRAGSSRLLLSLAAYSFRDYLPESGRRRPAQTDAGKQMDMFRFVDFCADHGCVGAELTSYYFPPDPTSEYLLKLKRHAFLKGIEISGTAVGNTFTLPNGAKRDEQIASVKKWVDRAAVLGAPHIRVFAGGTEGGTKEQSRKLCIAALEECCDYAGSKGIFLGLENHGGIVAEANDILEIVRAVNSPWFGINLDTGNFSTAEPYGDIAKCAPYAVNVQYKAAIHPRGQSKQTADMARIVKILRDVNYQGYVALEYEEAEDPWTAVPRHLKQLREMLT